MGKTIRNSTYSKDVLHGKRSLKREEAAEITNKYGVKRIIFGPCIVKLVCSNIRFLDRYVANADQFLRIIHKTNMTIEHIQGPCEKFLLPMHDEIKVLDLIKLRDIDVLYRVTEEGETFVKGPMNYLPSSADKIIKVFRNGLLINCMQLAGISERFTNFPEKKSLVKYESNPMPMQSSLRSTSGRPSVNSADLRPLSTDSLKHLHLQYMRPVTVADVMNKRQRNSRNTFTLKSVDEDWSNAYMARATNENNFDNHEESKISPMRINSVKPLRSPLKPLDIFENIHQENYYENPLRKKRQNNSDVFLNVSPTTNILSQTKFCEQLSNSPIHKCQNTSKIFKYNNKDLKTLTFAL